MVARVVWEVPGAAAASVESAFRKPLRQIACKS